MSSNCVKCGGPHASSDCKKEREDEPKCFNCSQKHPANYQGCAAFVAAKQALLNRTRPTTNILTTKPAPPFPPLQTLPQTTTYSQILKNP
ncbi:hypothetical protein J437_LFUL015358 [Ladona fulva]|uniref:Uncharacterized protein n=1 Tax=Ladona fulva TaxID=123851 RepID=A0A8K0KHE1_LADFU|nr:hypothetical protein J437_LFUL015358 [Ladona fulva]